MSNKTKASKTSKGERPNVNRQLLNYIRAQRTPMQRMLFKLEAWRKGKNPWIQQEFKTPAGKTATRKVRSNELWGDPKARYKIKGSSGED